MSQQAHGAALSDRQLQELSKTVCRIGRYASCRPNGLQVDSDGWFSLEDLATLSTQLNNAGADDLERAVEENAMKGDERRFDTKRQRGDTFVRVARRLSNARRGRRGSSSSVRHRSRSYDNSRTPSDDSRCHVQRSCDRGNCVREHRASSPRNRRHQLRWTRKRHRSQSPGRGRRSSNHETNHLKRCNTQTVGSQTTDSGTSSWTSQASTPEASASAPTSSADQRWSSLETMFAGEQTLEELSVIYGQKDTKLTAQTSKTPKRQEVKKEIHSDNRNEGRGSKDRGGKRRGPLENRTIRGSRERKEPLDKRSTRTGTERKSTGNAEARNRDVPGDAECRWIGWFLAKGHIEAGVSLVQGGARISDLVESIVRETKPSWNEMTVHRLRKIIEDTDVSGRFMVCKIGCYDYVQKVPRGSRRDRAKASRQTTVHATRQQTAPPAAQA